MESSNSSCGISDSDSLCNKTKSHKQYAQVLKSEQDQYFRRRKEQKERLNYILQQAETYANFLFQGEQPTTGSSKPKHTRKRSKKPEDSDILSDMQNQIRVSRIQSQPSSLKGGQLRSYQLDGVNWLISLYQAGINGILADEMGLGKTIQCIGFLAYLREQESVPGPHLIIVPKSTMGNWCLQFKKWTPEVRVVKLIASKPYRDEIIKKELIPGKFDVVVTSYEGVSLCHQPLKKVRWKFLIIDEAHKIKNEESNLSQLVRSLHTINRLLITGTPLQNNLHELWSLLNFLLPDIFTSSSDFDEWFNLGAEEGLSAEEIENKNVKMVQQLHKILKPFLLRRTKAEVERGIPPKQEIHVLVGMSSVQRELYKKILTNDLCKQDSKCHYLNVVMQLRKVCNHPYLFPGVEDETLGESDEHLIYNSGKMKILDRLLSRLKAQESQVLIFSQMTTSLDILEDYCNFRKYPYCRLDGNTGIYEREQMIAEFSKPGSDLFIFLLSTRAGGLGINLTSADTVVIYDSDWNPQMDLQAMDRAHRIGQTKQVNVYRLITKNSLEERIIQRQCLRLKLDSLIIQTGRLAPNHKSLDKEELQEMLHYGADVIFGANEEDTEMTEEQLDSILQRGVQRAQKIDQELESQLEKKKNLIQFESKIDMWNFESVDYSKKRKEESRCVVSKAVQERMLEDMKARRERKYMQSGSVEIQPKTREFKPAPDYKFYQNRVRLLELQKAEFHKELTDEERVELEKILATGLEWSRKEYMGYIKGCELYGKGENLLISEIISTKTEQEVKEYAQIFWERLDELVDREKILKSIEKRENLVEKHKQAQRTLDKKFGAYKNPWREMIFDSTNSHKSRIFTHDNDKYLICMAKTVGYGNWDELKVKIRKSSCFRFDYMLRSRTSAELQRRVDSLIRILEKEDAEPNQAEFGKRRGDDLGDGPVKKFKVGENADQCQQLLIDSELFLNLRMLKCRGERRYVYQ